MEQGSDEDVLNQMEQGSGLPSNLTMETMEEVELTSAVAGNSTALPTDYTRLTVAQLKIELKQRDLPTDGKKAELVARLDEHDVSPSSSIAAASSTTDHGLLDPRVSDLERDRIWRNSGRGFWP